MKLTAAQQTNLDKISALGPLVRRNFTWYRAADTTNAHPIRGLNMKAIDSLQKLGLVGSTDVGFGVTEKGAKLAHAAKP